MPLLSDIDAHFGPESKLTKNKDDNLTYKSSIVYLRPIHANMKQCHELEENR